MGEIEKYIGRRLDGGNVIPVLSAGLHPDAKGVDVARLGFNLEAERIHKFGSNPGIDSLSVPEDVWDGSAVYSGFVPTFVSARVRSSDPADDGSPAGAGAHTIRIEGLDPIDMMFKTRDITLNGTGNVSADTWLRIFRAYILTAGNPTNTNVGTITIDEPGGTLMAQIEPGRGQTLMAIYTVPADYKQAWILQWSASLQAGNAQARSAELALEIRPFGGAWNTKEFVELHSYGGLAVYNYPLPIPIGAKSDIRWRVLGVSSNATLVNATFDLYLEPQ